VRAVVFLISLSILISGCATPIPISIGEDSKTKDFSSMYLRGIMNWWEASEPYRFRASESDLNVYTLDVELIADGQPYDFKVADNLWSNDVNCGMEFGEQVIIIDKQRELYCAGDSANIKFTPQQTGLYQLRFDVSKSASPKLKIQRIE